MVRIFFRPNPHMNYMENADLTDMIISSNRGKEKLIYNYYEYYVKRKIDGYIFWNCNNKNCKGKIKTDLGNKLISYNNHNHERNVDRIEAKRIMNNIEKRTLETT